MQTLIYVPVALAAILVNLLIYIANGSSDTRCLLVSWPVTVVVLSIVAAIWITILADDVALWRTGQAEWKAEHGRARQAHVAAEDVVSNLRHHLKTLKPLYVTTRNDLLKRECQIFLLAAGVSNADELDDEDRQDYSQLVDDFTNDTQQTLKDADA
jgi:hypothetical protein